MNLLQPYKWLELGRELFRSRVCWQDGVYLHSCNFLLLVLIEVG
jgi:hypothetical protein